jgi:copper chaperone
MNMRVRVEGMTCQHCVRAVFTALAAVDGIARADVRIGSVEIEHDGSVTVEAVRSAIAIAGYSIGDAEVNRRSLPLL